jgi:hypothetical protein
MILFNELISFHNVNHRITDNKLLVDEENRAVAEETDRPHP